MQAWHRSDYGSGQGTGGDAERRVYSVVGRSAQGLGRRRSAFRGLGGLPHQGLQGRSEPSLRGPGHRLVRATGAEIGRRRQELGPGEQRIHLRRRSGHPPRFRRQPAPLGVQAGLAPRALACRSGNGVRGRRGRGALPLDGRGPVLAGTGRPEEPPFEFGMASRRGRALSAHHPAG